MLKTFALFSNFSHNVYIFSQLLTSKSIIISLIFFLYYKMYIINRTIPINQIFDYSNTTKNSYLNHNNNNLDINLYRDFYIYIKTNISLVTISQLLFQFLIFNNT